MTQQQSWADKYERELVPVIFEPWSHTTVATVAPQRGEHALDIACGTGIVARCAASYIGPQGRIVGIDSDHDMITTARSLPAHPERAIEWVEGDAQQLPFADATFDMIFCQGGLQFIPDRSTALQEMYRVLKPGGRAVVMLFREIQYAPGFALLAETVAPYVAPRMIKSIVTPFSLGKTDEAQKLAEQAGFQRISIREETKDARFPSAEAFIRARLLATYHYDTMNDQILTRALEETGKALRPYEVDGELIFPMAGYLLLAHKG